VSQPPFQRFLDAHREDVWRFLVASVGRDAADDCFQETFSPRCAPIPKMRQDNPRAWVLTIAHRKALDHFRARKRRAVPVGDDLPDVAAPPIPNPATTASGRASTRCRPSSAAPVLLRFAGDLSHREVAAAMGVSEEAARRNAFEGLRKLRQEMT
jgi:DNA-directed RNA polymerase specialized sigma24 family protein